MSVCLLYLLTSKFVKITFMGIKFKFQWAVAAICSHQHAFFCKVFVAARQHLTAYIIQVKISIMLNVQLRQLINCVNIMISCQLNCCQRDNSWPFTKYLWNCIHPCNVTWNYCILWKMVKEYTNQVQSPHFKCAIVYKDGNEWQGAIVKVNRLKPVLQNLIVKSLVLEST